MSYVGDPGRYGELAALSDTVNQAQPFRSLYIGTTGNVSVLQYNGTNVVYSNVPVGILSVQGLRVNSTGTTAGNIICMW